MIPRPDKDQDQRHETREDTDTQTCEDVGANKPGQSGDIDTGQQGDGVQCQQMENNELEDIWPD